MAKRKTKIETPKDEAPEVKVTISGGDGGEFAGAVADIFRNAGADVEVIPPGRVHKAGGRAEVVSQSWDINITPQWRAQIIISTDVPKSLDEAKRLATDELFKKVVASYPTVRMTPSLNWVETSPDTWIATGNDGVEETTLPLVTITRVVS